MAQQGPPPDRSSRRHRSGERASPEAGSRVRWQRSDRLDRSWQADPFADSDASLPAWAEPVPGSERGTSTLQRSGPSPDRSLDEALARPAASEPGLAGGTGARRGRAAATRLRKSRRRVYRWAAVAIAVCVVGAAVAILALHRSPHKALFVTSLLPGEYRSVPSACTAVSTSVLDQYLPGPGRTSTSEVSGTTSSQCSFTIDHKPLFLVLEVSAEAYQPFAAATGRGSAAGSASANAEENYSRLELSLARPPKHSPLSAAQITPLAAAGQQAFVAVQAEHVSGIRTDVVTVIIRERNVIITVAESGQESGHGFGPVPVATLQAGAVAAARDALAKARTQPTA